jgi:hypothetical protein
MACSNRMKELIQKNKFKHRLGPSGYKATIPLWTKKEQEFCEAGIDDKGQFGTSNYDITRVVENVKDLVNKEKTNEFKLQHQKDQLSIAIEIAHELSLQLHCGRKGLRRTSICTRSVEDTI